MNAKPTTKRKLTPVKSNDLREIGRQLAYMSKLYIDGADELDKSQIREIELKGAANLHNTMDRLNGAVQSLQKALSVTRTAVLKRPIRQVADEAVAQDAAPSPQKRQRKGSSK